MFEVATEFLIDCTGVVPTFIVVVLIFNIISDLLFNK